ncbi:hypothetical protein ACS0PU_010884 [Formica fusca]
MYSYVCSNTDVINIIYVIDYDVAERQTCVRELNPNFDPHSRVQVSIERDFRPVLLHPSRLNELNLLVVHGYQANSLWYQSRCGRTRVGATALVDGKQIKGRSSQDAVAVPGPRHSRARLISSSEWWCIARQLITLVRCRGSWRSPSLQSQYMSWICLVRSVRSVRGSSGACTRP